MTKAVVNSMIEVNGLGKRFLEDVYISGVEHLVKEGNWITRIRIGILPDNALKSQSNNLYKN